MAAKKKTAGRTGLDDFEDPDMTGGDDDEVGAFLSSLDDECTIYLTRRESNGDRSQCGKYAWEVMKEDPIEFIRKTWGPGRYWVRSRRPGVRHWDTAKTIIIARKPDETPAAHFSATPGTVSSAAEIQIAMLREELQSQRALTNTLIANLTANRGGSDVGQLLSGLGNILKPPDFAGQFTALMGAVRAAQPAAAAAPQDELARLKGLLEVAKSLGTNGDGEPSWIAIAEKALEKLPALLRPAAVAPPPITVTPVAPAPAPVLPQPEIEDDMQKRFIEVLTQAVTTARAQFRAGVKPEDHGRAVWEGRNEPANNALVSAIHEGATIERLVFFVPEIGASAEELAWFHALYAVLAPLVRG